MTWEFDSNADRRGDKRFERFNYTTIANPTMSFFNACSSLRASTSKLFSRAGPSNPTATTIRPASSYVSLGDLKPSKGSNKDVCGFALAHEKTGLTD
jgi:hypothetical protein